VATARCRSNAQRFQLPPRGCGGIPAKLDPTWLSIAYRLSPPLPPPVVPVPVPVVAVVPPVVPVLAAVVPLVPVLAVVPLVPVLAVLVPRLSLLSRWT
jgi:hypothetical protein